MPGLRQQLKPKLFISYASEDRELAQHLKDGLSLKGYEVFYDRDTLLVGQDFTNEIKKWIDRIDGLIFILSANSIQSEWCRAEVYSAIANKKSFIPIRYRPEQLDTTQQFILFQKNINYVEVHDSEGFDNALKQVDLLLSTSRRKVYSKWAKRLTLILLSTALFIFLFSQLVMNINTWTQANERSAYLNEIQTSTEVYNQRQIERHSNKFEGDEKYLKELIAIYRNRLNSNAIRMNALLILTLLEEGNGNNSSSRWFIDDINLNDLQFTSGTLGHITFNASLGNIEFKRSNFDRIIWGNGMSNLKFTSSYFSANTFAPEAMIRADFENCEIYGSEINVENYGDVHFYFRNSDSTSSTITNELALIENSVIKNCVSPPDPGVLEILEEDSEVRFTGVLFVRTHFQGFIRPSWFKNCIFENCVFPSTLSQNELESGQNILQNVIVSDEACF